MRFRSSLTFARRVRGESLRVGGPALAARAWPTLRKSCRTVLSPNPFFAVFYRNDHDSQPFPHAMATGATPQVAPPGTPTAHGTT